MRLCENNVEKLKTNPVVLRVNERKIELKVSFLIQIFEKWKVDQSFFTIEKELMAVDINKDDINPRTIEFIHRSFLNKGYPRHANRFDFDEDKDYVESNPLILSGAYHKHKSRWALEIDEKIRESIKDTYPTVSVETKMQYLGINPLDVGYNRIRKLTRELDSELAETMELPENSNLKKKVFLKNIEELQANPYVQNVSRAGVFMTEDFYNETYMLTCSISKIMEIYGINAEEIDSESLIHIKIHLAGWRPLETKGFSLDEEVLKIQNRRAIEMNNQVRQFFDKLGNIFHDSNLRVQRKICCWIAELPMDPWHYYTVKKIREIMGISRTKYYQLLNNPLYGYAYVKRLNDDDADIEIIRKVASYKGFEKGIRQIYMLMPRVTGVSFSIHKIRRLMNKYGMRTNIRQPSKNRKVMKELIERNKKANLVMRRFKLFRPNEVRLTDVTYLDYGNDYRAYGSASVDPVTGRLVCFVVSENNDLQLALDTLAAMDRYPAKSGGILHSDQGMLYMTDTFQEKVLELKLQQSMSRRGNCWDNAVQESFFGHFKDECHYEKCESIDELKKCIEEYSDYYNNERGMWTREKMTPVEYEAYLEGLSDDEFEAYLDREEKIYEKMKEKSTLTAITAAKEYKDFTEKSLGEI